jgi:hypothetical protein
MSANAGPYSQPTAILGPSSLSENILTAFPEEAQAPISPPKTCSVRGCKRGVDPDSNTKMCEVCRGRHRIYATTKRARRKLEKATVISMHEEVGASASVTPDTNADPGPVVPNAEVSGWMSTQATPTTTTAATWDDTTIDPQLFPQSVSAAATTTSVNSTQNPLNYMGLHLSSYPPVPYVSSTSSELAGALTLPATASTTTASTGDDKTSSISYYRPRLPDGTLMQPDPTIPRSSTAGGSRTKERIRSHAADQQDQDEEESFDENESGNEEGQAIILTGDKQAFDTATDAVDGPRFCSVKGCKAVIPGPSSPHTFSRLPHSSPYSFLRLQNVPSLPYTVPNLRYHQTRQVEGRARSLRSRVGELEDQGRRAPKTRR